MACQLPVLLACLALFPSFGHAAGMRVDADAPSLNGPGSAATSSSLPDAPVPDFTGSRSPSLFGPKTRLTLSTRPFSQFAIGFTTGTGGLGVDVATPLATKINLHASASFLNYNPVITEETIPFDGSIQFRSIGVGVDVYPYRGTFHITPGFTLYNGNKATAVTNIVPGSTFTINDTNYVSDIADPVHGTFNVGLGRRIAPSLTIGFGNMLRRESNWSFPVDIGFQYIGLPKFVLNMMGTVCTAADGCTPIASDADTQKNLAQEQIDINKDIAPLRFYPILKIGVAYRFGHKTNMSLWR